MPTIRFCLRGCLIFVLALFVLGSQAQAQTGPNKGDLYVLPVGVNNAIGENPLTLPSKDAEAHERFWAGQQGKMFGTVTVVSPLVNEIATKAAILAALDRLTETAKPGSTVILPFSGHGGITRAGEWVFCAYDGYLPSSALRVRIEGLAKKGVVVILILDACQSGGVDIKGDNIVVLAACQADQSTAEVPGMKTSLYTMVLLQGLGGAADLNKDGVVTLAEVNAFVTFGIEQVEKEIQKGEPSYRQNTTSSIPANVRSNLPLAVVGQPAPAGMSR